MRQPISQFRSVRAMLTARPVCTANWSSVARIEEAKASKVRRVVLITIVFAFLLIV